MKKVKFTPISAKLVLERIEKNELSDGGIVIPENVRSSFRKGEAETARVLAVGPGLDEYHSIGGGMECQVNDIVLIQSNEGLNFSVNGKRYLSLYERFVLAIVEQPHLEDLRSELRKGIDEFEAGKGSSITEVAEHLKQRRKKAGKVDD